MEDNKKDYSDFFKRSEKEEPKLYENSSAGEEQQQEKPSYYYSYGPYKSPNSDTIYDQESTSASLPNVCENVEVSVPRPVKAIDSTDSSSQSSMGHWTHNGPHRRSSGRSVFAAFLAGALVVGSLMFASDKMNLFTGDHSLAGPSNGSIAAGSSNGGSLKNVGIDMARPNNIAQIVQNSSPAVVKIETLVKAKSRTKGGSSLFDDPMFRQFFGNQLPPQSQQQDNSDGALQAAGMGSGFLFEKSGYILTNEHVVDGANQIQVTVQGYDTPFKAKLLGNSYDLDLAVLKIEGTKDFSVLPLGNAEDTNVGDWVVAIGNPYGFDHTVTVGVLSAKERPIDIPDNQGTRKYQHLFQTDASINPGNSGGPLLNLNGEVIGINTAVSAQAQGIGFAIPTSTIASVIDNLKNNVTIPKEPDPFIGVALGDIDKSYLTDLGLDNTDGAIISEVQIASPGFKAGLKTYDVVLGINGEKAKNSAEVVAKIKKAKVGDKVTLNIVRDGKKVDVIVTIGNRNDVKTK